MSSNPLFIKRLLCLTLLAGGLLAGGNAIAQKSGEFAYSLPADIISMDPQSTRVISTTSFLGNIMEPLVRLDADNKPEGALAKSWERTGPTTWRFDLRKGVKFTTGNPFTAEDVKFTIERAKKASSPYRGMVASIASVTKVDDATVIIETAGPSPTLLRELPALLILDAEWVKKNNAAEPVNAADSGESFLARNASGTGPYKVAGYQPGVRIDLAANPAWWDTANRGQLIPKVSFKPIKSDPTRVAALLSDEVDLIDPLPVDDIPRLRRSPNFQVITAPSARTIMLILDSQSDELHGSDIKGKNPFKDVRVRRAAYQAIDTQVLIQKIMNDLASPAAIPIAPSLTGYDAKLDVRDDTFDIDAAKKLLAEAGYPNGFSFTLDCTAGRYINDERVCLALVSMWAKVGLKVTLAARPPALHFAEVAKGKSNAYLYGYGTDLVLDGNLFLKNVVHSKDGKVFGSENYNKYSNAHVDELIEKAQTEMDPDTRNSYLREAYARIKRDLVYLPLYNERVIWGARADVKATPSVTGVLLLYRLRRAQ